MATGTLHAAVVSGNAGDDVETMHKEFPPAVAAAKFKVWIDEARRAMADAGLNAEEIYRGVCELVRKRKRRDAGNRPQEPGADSR